jgi:hypothetical protein
VNCGAHGSVVVELLCYNPEGRQFETRRGNFYKFTSSFQPHWALWFNQHLPEMNTRRKLKNVYGE